MPEERGRQIILTASFLWRNKLTCGIKIYKNIFDLKWQSGGTYENSNA